MFYVSIVPDKSVMLYFVSESNFCVVFISANACVRKNFFSHYFNNARRLRWWWWCEDFSFSCIFIINTHFIINVMHHLSSRVFTWTTAVSSHHTHTRIMFYDKTKIIKIGVWIARRSDDYYCVSNEWEWSMSLWKREKLHKWPLHTHTQTKVREQDTWTVNNHHPSSFIHPQQLLNFHHPSLHANRAIDVSL